MTEPDQTPKVDTSSEGPFEESGDSLPAPPVLLSLPEELLGPLLQWVGEGLREMKAQEVPPAVRPMLSFDRRGFGNAAARAQLHRAIEADPEFRERVFEAIGGRSEVAASLRDWDVARAVEVAEDAVARDDLDLLASSLVLARPDGWELGVGVALALLNRRRSEQLVDDDRRAFETQVDKATEAQRRAEAEAERWRAEAAGITAELKEERASRRQREEAAQGEALTARKRVSELEAALAESVAAAGRAGDRLRKEAERGDELENELQQARSEAARLRADAERAGAGADQAPPGASVGSARGAGSGPPPVSSEELDLLTRASDIARRLTAEAAMPGVAPAEPPTGEPAGQGAAGAAKGPRSPSRPDVLPPVPEGLEDAAAGEVEVDESGADAGPAGPASAARGPRRTRRAPVEVPSGLIGASVPGLRGALAKGNPAIVVDGYNVSMLAWGDDPPDTQRQRLCALLERLYLRTNRTIVVVFDGADVEGSRPPRRPGVRVVFSNAGEEADDVVIREVRALPLERPAIVVSSDREVQGHADDAGAMVVPSSVFLEFLRK